MLVKIWILVLAVVAALAQGQGGNPTTNAARQPTVGAAPQKKESSLSNHRFVDLSDAQATILAGILGLLGGFAAAEINRRQKADELFFAALKFLAGGTQNRNLGISAIELYRKKRRHRELTVSLLVGAAIYLLLESNQADAEHEVYNLRRIMWMLLSEEKLSKPRQIDCQNLLCAMQRKKAGKARRGLTIEDQQLDAWIERLTTLTGPRRS